MPLPIRESHTFNLYKQNLTSQISGIPLAMPNQTNHLEAMKEDTTVSVSSFEKRESKSQTFQYQTQDSKNSQKMIEEAVEDEANENPPTDDGCCVIL